MHRLRAGLLRLLAVAGVAALFSVGFAGALVGHLNLPAGRRAAAEALAVVLYDLFQGEVTIGSLTQVSPGKVAANDVVVRDQAHRVVLKVSRLTARADVLDIVRRVVQSDPKLTVKIDHVRLEHAEANIIPAEDGIPTLAHALTPRPTPTASPTDPERYVRVWLPEIEIGQLFARGNVGGSPTLEIDVSGVHGSVLASPKGAAIDVQRFSLLARGLGGADAKGIATLHIRSPGALWGSFDGYMGDVQFGSVVRWEKDALDLKLDLPRAEPAAARALLAQWPLLVPAGARLRIQGKPPGLRVDAQAKVGDAATLSADGTLHTGSAPRLQLDIEGRKLDLRAIWANAPATSIDVDTGIAIGSEGGETVVELGGSLQPTRVQALVVPLVDFSGKASADGGFRGEAKLHDAGLPLDVGFTLHADGKLDIDAEAKAVDLAKVTRIKPYFDGSGQVDLRAQATLEHGRIDGKLALDVRSLRYQGVTLQSGRLTGGARGALAHLDQLALDARLTGKKLSVGRFDFAEVSASARGPLNSTTVATALQSTNGPSFDARAVVVWGEPLGLRDVSLGVTRDNVEIRGSVAQVDIADDRVLVRELSLRGASGELQGSAELTPTSLSVTAQGQNLDLSAISRVLGLPRGSLEGRASLSIDALSTGKTQRGTLELSLSKGAVGGVTDVSGQLSAKLDGRHFSGASAGRVEALGGFVADWDTQLGGPPTERASFERATGAASIALEDVTLDYLGLLVTEPKLDVAGAAELRLHLKRDAPDAVPNIEVSAQTHGLDVRALRQGSSPLVLSGVELLASATHDGASGNTSLALGVKRGEERLVSSSADLKLDLKAALNGSESLENQLRSRPLSGKVVINQLELQTLPAPLRQPGLRGSVRLEGTLRGTATAPIGSVSVRAANLHLAPGDRADPIDLCGTAEYAPMTGAFMVGAEVFLPGGLLSRGPCSGPRVANVRLNGSAPWHDAAGLAGWTGTALVTLEALPFATIPPLADARMTGTVSGTLLLDRSGAEPNASGLLQLAQVKVDRQAIGDGTLKLRSDAAHARLDFRVERGSASVDGSVNAGVSWREAVPALSDAAPIDVSLKATKLEASLLEPFLSDFVNELRGNVNGNVNARLEPLRKGEASRRIEQVGGQVRLDDGSLVLTGLGFRLRDVEFTASAKRDGKTTLIEVGGFKANAGTSKQNLTSEMSFRLAGLDIVSGSVSLNVDDLPLVVDGITRATAKVRITHLTITRNQDHIRVDVPFDELVAHLPDQSSRTLISLNDNTNIKLLQPITEPKASRDEGALPWLFAIHLGDRAAVQRRDELNLPITGDPTVVLAAGLGVTGSVTLQRHGTVVLLGKTFVIEGGAVVFDTPDPADPRLDVRASWRSPTSDTLFMYVSGTIAHPKVQFDRPADQALALLRGGTETTTATTADIGFGVLDTLLADTPLARVQLRGQEAQDGTRRTTYTAAYRVGDKVVVEGNYRAAGSSATDQAPTIGAAVDWRLTKTISLRGQLGTIGTGVDLVYQYRY